MTLQDKTISTWHCTSDSSHTEPNDVVSAVVAEMDEQVKGTAYFSSPEEWEQLLTDVSKVLHPGT